MSEIVERIKNTEKSRLFFYLLTVLVFCAMIFVAFRAGSGGDDVLDGNNGKYALKYYSEGDTTFTHYSRVEEVKFDHMKYYGVGFEILPALVVKTFHCNAHELLIRRMLICLFGFVLMFFAALIAKDLRNWKLASVTFLVMALTPTVFGLSFCGSKDIPLATGFAVFTFFCLRFCRSLPHLHIQHWVGMLIGIALAVSIRIGGLLLLFYLAVGVLMSLWLNEEWKTVWKKKQYSTIGKVIAVCLGVGILGALLGLMAYPNFFYEGPIDHIRNAFAVVSKFKQRIPFMFGGKLVDSTHLPDFYLMKAYLLTIPVWVLLGLLAFICLVKKVIKQYDRMSILFLVFLTVFPPFYIWWTDANIYTGWRHTLFIYSACAVLSAIGLYALYDLIRQGIFRKAYLLVMIIAAGGTACWMIRNYKYTYSYYNCFVADPYLNYEQDYFETSATEAYDWLRKNELSKSTGKVVVSTKIQTPLYYAAMLGDTNVIVKQVPFMAFAETDCDYSILNFQIISSHILKKFFPPKGTIHVECVDGRPVCAVVKRNKLDSQGIKAIREGKWEEGMKLLEQAYAYDSNNFGIWFWMGYGYYFQKKYKESLTFFQKYMNFSPFPQMAAMAMMYAGHSFVELRMYDEAIQTLGQAMQMVRNKNDKSFIAANLGIAYYHKKSYKQAINYLQQIVDRYPELNSLLQAARQEHQQ